jgi:hypothetical protein
MFVGQTGTATKDYYTIKIIYKPRNQELFHAKRTNQNITHISTLELVLKLNEGFIPLLVVKPHR